MLSSLHIKNIAVIDETDAVFGSGLNVLTGETGAGKSIIIDSMGMVLGERTSREMVRHGENKACVQALFHGVNSDTAQVAAQMGFCAEGGDLLLGREMTADGKSTCRIGSQLATSAALRDLGRNLINIHGQHDSQLLLHSAHHIDFLDSFAGSQCLTLREEFCEKYGRYQQLVSQIKSMQTDEIEKNRQIDLLQYQITEIEAADLQPGEEQQLAEQHKVASHAERILEAVSQAYQILYDGETTVYDGLSNVSRLLGSVADFDTGLSENVQIASDLLYSTADLSSALRAYRDSLDFDPQYLEQIEQRQQIIFSLKRKYGGSIAEILSSCEQMRGQLAKLESAEQDVAALQQEADALQAELSALGASLTRVRKAAAAKLDNLVETELSDLDMAKTKFHVQLQSTAAFHPSGCDQVEFLISTNPGEPLKPLAKIASGGELSRIMLALKSVLAESDTVQTLIFDEIDTGVSGRAAQKIALKLCQIARHKQVICITHLAQIASMADHHYLIEKVTTSTTSSTHIRALDDEQRQTELSRMIGGVSITDTTRQHAEEMLRLARETKEKLSCGKLAE